MEKEETGQRQSGIFNYFEGATINNLVINNGTYNKSGVDHHYYSSKDKTEKHSYSDEQIAQAIENINGEGKPIDSKQKWAAVYWYLRWQCNFPVKGSEFCERIQRLPFTKKLDPECEYNNIRKLTTLSFMSQDARHLETVKPSKMDEQMFAQCRIVVNALAEELEKASAA
jgi:hypothetical protein